MVNCVCGKPIEKVPEWLSAVQINFVCSNCPNHTVKSITEVSLGPAMSAAGETGAIEPEIDEADEDED
ncbi:MAG: hypothetical protein KF857_03145 [Fimbriimonadaceae bacterium]|nr:hypothetical protein [Fimbriimonadaceae bacterium]